ncbi:hypothetical protein EV426DRAFT_710009 [Tirmania nivea]|nr:hypothetical protein EV426DRAFT_710009 [Tirmania nivea]
MITAKHLIKNSKADLGWDTRDADYTAWRNASGASEAQRDALVIAARTLTGFRPSIRGRLVAGSEFYKKALEALLQDCLKKRSETAKNLAIKRARKRVHTESEDSDGQEEEGNALEQGTAMWDIRERRKLGIIQGRTLDGIWDMVKVYVPPNHKVREILGALEDPSPLNPTFPANHTIVLHTPDGRENSPPLYPTAASFAQDRFDLPNEYDDPAEDSDALVRVSAGVRKRRMPTKDHTFEQQYKRKFPDVQMIDLEDEGFCYLRHLKKPKYNTGAQLVKARQVVGVERRATEWNRRFGVGRFVSKIRGINAAQATWEALNGNNDDGIHGVAPLPKVMVNNPGEDD